MLGQSVSDLLGMEGKAGTSRALGLLDMSTEMSPDKRLAQVKGVCAFDPQQAQVSGYEIHMGVSTGSALEAPAFQIDGRPEGALSADGQVLGTYLHGLFDTPQAISALLRWAGLESQHTVDTAALREASLDRIADATQPLLDALIALK
jgi:adenosylcobyric acid synthase